jgi:hypothetical protein
LLIILVIWIYNRVKLANVFSKHIGRRISWWRLPTVRTPEMFDAWRAKLK